MGQVIDLQRFRSPNRVVPDPAPPRAPWALPFLCWRSAVVLWSSLWLAPLGLRVEASDGELPTRRR